MPYKNIKSDFVRKEVQKTKWKNRNYIDDLINIEGFALREHFGLWSGYLRNYLLWEYSQQWKAIWLELNPKAYHKDIEFEKKKREREKREDERGRKTEALKLKRDKLEWKKVGGEL